MSAMHLAATAIDAGQIKFALIVDGEGSRQTQLATIKRLQQENATAVDDAALTVSNIKLRHGSLTLTLHQ